MSNLHKQVLKNQAMQKPPIQKSKIQQSDSDSDEKDDEDELKDQFSQTNGIQQFICNNKKKQLKKRIQSVNLPPQTMPAVNKGPVKGVHMDLKKDNSQQQQQQQSKISKIHDYTPQLWDNFFDQMLFMDNGTPLYIAGIQNSPIYLCLHGAGHSAMSFALVASQIKQFGMCIAFDFRGHGQSKINDETLSAEQLIIDTTEVIEYISMRFPEPTIILVGHSMGGSIATKTTQSLLSSNLQDKIQGLIVIDVVEGTALEALPFMENIVNSRPKSFKSYEQAIKWSISSSHMRNLKSARVSIPSQLIEVIDESGQLTSLKWQVDLMKSDQYWKEWFQGLTQAFLNVRIPKLLMLAEKERMDKELTVAQMQGKFKLVVLQDTGHSIQEDDPENTAFVFHDFLGKFRIPTTITELVKMKTVGIGKFHPNVKPFSKNNK